MNVRDFGPASPVKINVLKYYAVKLIFSFLLSYPLAGLLKRIPDAKPYQKNLFIVLCVQEAVSYMTKGLTKHLAFLFST